MLLNAIKKQVNPVTQERLAEMDSMFVDVVRPQDPLLQAIQLAQRRVFLISAAESMDDAAHGFTFGTCPLDHGLAQAILAQGFTLWRKSDGDMAIGMPDVPLQQLDKKGQRGFQPLMLGEQVASSSLSESKLPPLRSSQEEGEEIEAVVKQLFAGVAEPPKGFARQLFLSQRDLIVESIVRVMTCLCNNNGVIPLKTSKVATAFFPAIANAGCALWLEKTTYCEFITLPGVTEEVLNLSFAGVRKGDENKMVFQQIPLSDVAVDLSAQQQQ